MRVNITLECTSCHERTYLTSKNRRHNPDRLELNKYCPREQKVTLHRKLSNDHIKELGDRLFFYLFFIKNACINSLKR